MQGQRTDEIYVIDFEMAGLGHTLEDTVMFCMCMQRDKPELASVKQDGKNYDMITLDYYLGWLKQVAQQSKSPWLMPDANSVASQFLIEKVKLNVYKLGDQLMAQDTFGAAGSSKETESRRGKARYHLDSFISAVDMAAAGESAQHKRVYMRLREVTLELLNASPRLEYLRSAIQSYRL